MSLHHVPGVAPYRDPVLFKISGLSDGLVPLQHGINADIRGQSQNEANQRYPGGRGPSGPDGNFPGDYHGRNGSEHRHQPHARHRENQRQPHQGEPKHNPDELRGSRKAGDAPKIPVRPVQQRRGTIIQVSNAAADAKIQQKGIMISIDKRSMGDRDSLDDGKVPDIRVISQILDQAVYSFEDPQADDAVNQKDNPVRRSESVGNQHGQADISQSQKKILCRRVALDRVNEGPVGRQARIREKELETDIKHQQEKGRKGPGRREPDLALYEVPDQARRKKRDRGECDQGHCPGLVGAPRKCGKYEDCDGPEIKKHIQP